MSEASFVLQWIRVKHPKRHWFVFQLLRFQSSSLLMAGENVKEDDPNTWALAKWETQMKLLVPDFDLVQHQTLLLSWEFFQTKHQLKKKISFVVYMPFLRHSGSQQDCSNKHIKFLFSWSLLCTNGSKKQIHYSISDCSMSLVDSQSR